MYGAGLLFVGRFSHVQPARQSHSGKDILKQSESSHRMDMEMRTDQHEQTINNRERSYIPPQISRKDGSFFTQ
jgi:hypothetical protein